jgi:hypothetical protein
MPRKRNNPVSLSGEDRGRLEGLIAGGHAPARRLIRNPVVYFETWKRNEIQSNRSPVG